MATAHEGPETIAPEAGLLAGKVIIVTGASTGIGADAARLFTHEGASVVLGARSESLLAALCDELQAGGAEACYFAGDVSDPANAAGLVSAAMSRYGRLDGAFNNAGITQGGGLLADVTETRFDELMATNVKGIWLAMRAQIRCILDAGTTGSIVNTSSIGGIRATKGMAVYGASKHAVIGLTRGAAHDYGARGIRINAIAPGAADTAMVLAAKERDPRLEARITAMIPMRRTAQPNEVSQAAAWLLSDRASYVNGMILPVDGGLSS